MNPIDNLINSVLPPGHQWITPPHVMTGEFCGYLPGGEANIWYRDNGGGWGRIRAEDFIPGELDKLEPKCKVERFCGEANGPKGKTLIIRARKALVSTMKRSVPTKKGGTYYVIWLRTGQCVTGFAYPPKVWNHNEPEPDEGTYDPVTGQIHPGQHGKYLNPGENEIPIAEACYAVIGNERPYTFDSHEAAKNVALAIPGAKVEPWADD